MEKLMTPANVVTLVRICLVPVFVIALISPWPQWFNIEGVTDEGKSLAAAVIFIIISCTDWVDGYLARKRNEVTDFGKFMDPLADKILVCAALLALVELQVLPSWPVLIILIREFIVAGIRMVAATRGVVIAASWYGKFKTVFQIIAIVLFLVKDSLYLPSATAAFTNPLYILAWIVMIIALVLTVLSMLDYLAKARDLLGLSVKSPGDTTPVDKGIDLHDESPEGSNELIEACAADVIHLAERENATIACAESLTGGLIASALTSVAGSSSVVKGGIVSYTNEIKHKLLDVSISTLQDEGAVSEECAIAMAQGARQRLKTTYAVSVTGIAGPTGEEPGKPVGTVWMGLATPEGCIARHFLFRGDRQEVRDQTVLNALEGLREALADKA